MGKGKTAKGKAGAAIRHHSEIPWREFPDHFGGALSKVLAGPDTDGARRLDFRLSTYQPMAYVASHSHRVQEQVYYVLDGEGLMEIEGARTVVRAGTTIFIPPGVSHAIHNSGVRALTFLVITTPPDDG